METLVTPKTEKEKQQINLIDGSFTASEAADIINEVLKVKINFHKLHRLSITEGNNNDACDFDSGRIAELMNEQKISKDFFRELRLLGKRVKINSVINISLED